ncbi:MAG TPA: hypothetical protein VNV82_20005 [Bryobacteraceae bacterium]|jgi:hypothetical protein|nr:hypothetical protein [Bryobacteraceae bacterium]
MKSEPKEYEAFNSLVDRILAVPHNVIKQRIEEHRKQAALNPHKPGPKRKRRTTKPSVS